MNDIRIELAAKQHCTGCAACADVCPKGCITMQYNDSLHSYPEIEDSACIACGKCMKVCPALNKETATPIFPQHYYMAWHQNDDERMSSTSGGAGAALVSDALKKGWYVCGAVLDGDYHLSHVVTNDSNQTLKMKGSKYFQSSTTGTFSQIRELALQGHHVLFIGTPCQVAGLLRGLPEKLKQNVLTCGIICHGVNSPLVWKDYKEWLERENKSQLTEYHFRSKSHGWQKRDGGFNLRVAYHFCNGKTVDIPSWKNLFHTWFGHHYILRPSCFTCEYRKEQRNSDITIGDFWNVQIVNSKADTFKGVSAVITSTERGDEFVHSCEGLYIEQVDGTITSKVLKGYIENRTPEQQRSEIEKELSFEKEYLSKGFELMRKAYPAQTTVTRLIYALKYKLGLK